MSDVSVILQPHSDWIVKLRISFAIYLRATLEEMVSRFASVTSEEIIQIGFFVIFFIILVYTNSVSASAEYLAHRFTAR